MPKNKVQQRARTKREQEKMLKRRRERMRKIRVAVSTLLAALLAGGVFFACKSDNEPRTDTSAAAKAACGGRARGEYTAKKYSAAPKMAIDVKKTYTVTLETSCGTITGRLFPDRAPATVNNFVFLAREGFYDNTIFHRVIAGFMMQGGDPTGTGSGGPGYTLPTEAKPGDQFSKPGLFGMAKAGQITNGSQFFITEVPTPHLNGQYTIFGEVTEGVDVVKKVVAVPKEGEAPNPPVVLYKVTIAES